MSKIPKSHFSPIRRRLMASYPMCKDLGIRIAVWGGGHYVEREELRKGIIRNALDGKKFDDYFGVQTISGLGMYASDVEATFVRMITGKRIGTQLIPD